MSYVPGLFNVIAEQVVRGLPEQYLLVGPKFDGVRPAYLADEDVLVASALQRCHGVPPVNILQAEFYSLPGSDVMCRDGARGLLSVGGVLVEVLVRQLDEHNWRVLFTRVDAKLLYGDLAARVSGLEARSGVVEGKVRSIEKTLDVEGV